MPVAALSHPNIVALHDFGRENGIAFAVMELLEGEPMDRCLAMEHLPLSNQKLYRFRNSIS